MKYSWWMCAGLFVQFQVHAASDFVCMQDCFAHGYARGHCIAVCDNSAMPGMAAPGMLDQPGLPKNPAFDQMQQNSQPKRPLPAVADPKCMNDCQERGYNYMLCQKRCSYSLHGY
jgi:hypothetical protein